MLRCPTCGHDTFTQVRTTRTEFTVEFCDNGGMAEVSSECTDGGDCNDQPFECADCGGEFEDYELVRLADEDCPSCDSSLTALTKQPGVAVCTSCEQTFMLSA